MKLRLAVSVLILGAAGGLCLIAAGIIKLLETL